MAVDVYLLLHPGALLEPSDPVDAARIHAAGPMIGDPGFRLAPHQPSTVGLGHGSTERPIPMTDLLHLRLGGAILTAALTLALIPALPNSDRAPQLLPSAAAGEAIDRPPQTLYVSRHGSDRWPGSKKRPLRTVGRALALVRPAGHIVVRSGSYHESLVLDHQSDVTVTAAPRATVWLDGSSRVRGWKRDGRTWVRSGWQYNFDDSPTYTPGAPDGTAPGWRFINPAHPMAAHPDQVWVAGARQRQVSTRAAVGPGDFYVDDTAHALVLGSDPRASEVRASTLAQAVAIRTPGVTLRGINVRRYATSVPTMGTVTVEAPRAQIRDLQIVDNASTGLFVGSSHARIVRVRSVANGLMGLLANQAQDLAVRQSRFSRNNRERFNATPSAGGAKLARSSRVRIKDSRFNGNRATGLWFDVSDYDLRVLGSQFMNNDSDGLNLEVSSRAVLADNVIAGNDGFGMKINDSDHVQIWNNTLVGNDRAINVVQDYRDVDPSGTDRSWRPDLPWQNRHVGIYNNVISKPVGNCLVCVEDYTHRFTAAELDIQTNANVYQRAKSRRYPYPVVWANAEGRPLVFGSLVTFRAATGQEQSGRTSSANLLRADREPTMALRRLANRIALRQPAWLRSILGRRPSSPTYLGAQ